MENHPFNGKRIILIRPNGFVLAGRLVDAGKHPCLEDAVQIRYWAKRAGGLPELASSGMKMIPGDLFDKIEGLYVFSWENNVGCMEIRTVTGTG